MEKHTILRITWGKAFDEIYCHHASLFIPYISSSLFPPEFVRVGVTVRDNIIEKGKIVFYNDRTSSCYLRCTIIENGLDIPLNDALLLNGLSIDSWTKLRNGHRGIHKNFPISLFYQLPNTDPIFISINHAQKRTPYLISEPKFAGLKNGDKIDVEILID